MGIWSKAEYNFRIAIITSMLDDDDELSLDELKLYNRLINDKIKTIQERRRYIIAEAERKNVVESIQSTILH